MAAHHPMGEQPVAEREWFIAGRWQEYEGEGRANLLRIVGIGAFYAVELINYHGVHLGVLEMPAVVDLPFHQATTALAVAWVMVCLGVFLCLRERFFPAALKFISTGCDIVLLTAILTIADGPRSPLVVGYFPLLVLAAMRFSLSLVWFAALGSASRYLFLLGYAKWFSQRDLRVPRFQELIVLLALALSGIVLGQIIRDRVLGWIRRGELRAMNRRDVCCGRPSWVVLPEWLDDFERGRSALAPDKVPEEGGKRGRALWTTSRTDSLRRFTMPEECGPSW